MARAPRLIRDDGIYHIINRRVGRLELFDESGDFEAFEKVLAEAQARRPSVKVLSYILMHNHWHLLLQPGGGDRRGSGVA